LGASRSVFKSKRGNLCAPHCVIELFSLALNDDDDVLMRGGFHRQFVSGHLHDGSSPPLHSRTHIHTEQHAVHTPHTHAWLLLWRTPTSRAGLLLKICCKREQTLTLHTHTTRPHSEGVLEATKDFNLPRHSEELDVPNLQVIKLMQSFTSLEYVTERFAWRHYYW